MIQDFKSDFSEMINLIRGDKPFAFMRFADGEIGVMKGRKVIGSDNWISPDRVTLLGQDLLSAIARVDDSLYYGISCQCCDIEGRDYLLGLIKNSRSNVTFSNLFVNGNYYSFLDFIKTLGKPVYVVANESAGFYNFPLEVLGFAPVPNDCVNYWEENSVGVKQALKNSVTGLENQIFLISAGPMSEAIIDYLWQINPKNKYVDVGSAIAEYIHGRPIRDFAYTNSPYYNKNCVF